MVHQGSRRSGTAGCSAMSSWQRRYPTPTGPQLAANEMHQWVWAAAERLWATGHYREALQAAATAVESQVQGKAGVHKLAGADLRRKVFNVDDPKPGEPRLRPHHPTSGLSWRSAHEGAANFGAGCMMAIRNIVSHNLAGPDAGRCTRAASGPQRPGQVGGPGAGGREPSLRPRTALAVTRSQTSRAKPVSPRRTLTGARPGLSGWPAFSTGGHSGTPGPVPPHRR